MAKIVGKKFRLWLFKTGSAGALVEVGCADGVTLDVDTTVIEGVCRGDGNTREKAQGSNGFSISVSGFVDYARAFNLEEIIDSVTNEEVWVARLSTEEEGTVQYEFNGFIASPSFDFPQEEFSTYSFTFEVTGAPTKGTVSA